MLYELTDVTKHYAQRRKQVAALAGIDLTIDEGEFLAIQGSTGSGKTTLLQMLGAMDRPSGGKLDFEGRDLARMGERDLSELRSHSFGFIFQGFNLIPTLTAQENVETALVPWHVAVHERRRRAEEALAGVGLAERARHIPSELSGGEQQRVAIARALVRAPRVILADEPTGNLDERTRDDIIGLLEELWRERGQTLIVVTHDTWVASRASRRIWLDAGRIEEEETTGPHVDGRFLEVAARRRPSRSDEISSRRSEAGRRRQYICTGGAARQSASWRCPSPSTGGPCVTRTCSSGRSASSLSVGAKTSLLPGPRRSRCSGSRSGGRPQRRRRRRRRRRRAARARKPGARCAVGGRWCTPRPTRRRWAPPCRRSPSAPPRVGLRPQPPAHERVTPDARRALGREALVQRLRAARVIRAVASSSTRAAAAARSSSCARSASRRSSSSAGTTGSTSSSASPATRA